MRTAETMTKALDEMRRRLDNAGALVEENKREIFEGHRKAILKAAEDALEAQKKRPCRASSVGRKAGNDHYQRKREI